MPSMFELVKHFFFNFCGIALFTTPFLSLTVVFTATWTTAWSAQRVEQHYQSSDIRGLIDASGSMKKNDPDNQVMVFTNLQLQTDNMPNKLFAGETLNISLFMTEQNKKISDDNFLHFISVSVTQTEPVKKRWFLHDNGLRDDKEAHDGIFNIRIRKTLKAGKNQFILQAKGEQFQRKINHSVIVHEADLIHTRISQTQRDNNNYYQILISPNLDFINAETIKIKAQLITDNDLGQSIKLSQADPNLPEWSFESDQLNPDKNHHIVINMLTQTHNGRPIDYTSDPIQLTLPRFDNLLFAPAQIIKAEPVTEESGSDWLTGIIIAVIANIILGIGSWSGYQKWQQNRDKTYKCLIGELE